MSAITFSDAGANLKDVMDRVMEGDAAVMITRQGLGAPRPIGVSRP